MLNSPFIGVGGAIVFLPSLISLMVFGKSRGMDVAFQIGFNVTFALLGLCAVAALLYVGMKVIMALRSKE